MPPPVTIPITIGFFDDATSNRITLNDFFIYVILSSVPVTQDDMIRTGICLNDLLPAPGRFYASRTTARSNRIPLGDITYSSTAEYFTVRVMIVGKDHTAVKGSRSNVSPTDIRVLDYRNNGYVTVYVHENFTQRLNNSPVSTPNGRIVIGAGSPSPRNRPKYYVKFKYKILR